MSDDDAPRARAFHPKKAINRKTKKHIVFDPEARKEFLTGFHKRKQERRRKAQEDLKIQLKEERKRLKQEAKETFKKLLGTQRADPAPEDLATESYDLENHSVSIFELSAADLAEKNNWIGPNRVQYEDEKVEHKPKKEEAKEEIPGMELTRLRDVKIALKKKATQEVKKSKAFQQKSRVERQKNRKKSLQQKKRNIKMHEKKNKRKGKFRGNSDLN
ncbi:hypothetical protein R5R35_011215 [Gryllus longicercus]|uniref:Nucleolar protein 12 n=1 Tax=Gryllus longicercus TaxID=2509291 RepID=A0AAN9Z8S5_9ORTH